MDAETQREGLVVTSFNSSRPQGAEGDGGGGDGADPFQCGMRNAECGMRNAECGMRNWERAAQLLQS
jgi:hypothetical protein